MKKSTLINVALLLVSVIGTCLFAEYALRTLLFGGNPSFNFLKNPAYYTVYLHDENEDFYTEDYWKLNYLFHKSFNVKNPIPLLGWGGNFDPVSLYHKQSSDTVNKRPLLFYGDSFAMCVDSVDCFEDYLNNDTAFSKTNVFLNYGVGGYGIDQIYLLFHETAVKYQKPSIVLSMLTTDLDRSMLKVRDAQKPYFELIDDALVLKGTPITMTSEAYFEENPPEISSYLWNRFQNSVGYLFKNEADEKAQYIAEIKRLNEAILAKTFEELKALNTEFLVVLFQPAWHSGDPWRLNFLKQVCYKYEVPYICDADIRKSAIQNQGHDPIDHYIPNDGHPTSLANGLMASEIKAFVLDSLYLEKLNTQIEIQHDPVLKRKLLRGEILKNPEWLNSIKEKAKDKGISLDSMISIDVEYMIEQEIPI